MPILFFAANRNHLLTELSVQIILFMAMLVIMVGLFVQTFKPTSVFAFTVLTLTVLQIIPVSDLFDHAANESIITIFLLIFITNALKENFNLLGLLDGLFKSIKHPRFFMLSFSAMVSGLSSLVNNTPIVALFIPYIYNWSKRRKLPPSKFLIPLSFAATLGGTITLIGTSTNLVLNGLMVSNGFEPFAFGDFFELGLLVTVAGIVLLTVIGYWLLPAHQDLLDRFEEEQRKYIVEMILPNGNDMIGKTITDAELRNLEGVYLVEINRDNRIISPVPPTEVLREGDLLYFAGETEKVIDLAANKKYGLQFPKTEEFNLGKELDLVEALVPAMSDLGGKSVKQTNFRDRFDAAIVAIQRDGERMGGKIGDLEIQYGDLLLLTAGSDYRKKVRNSRNLYNLSSLISFGHEKNTQKIIFGFLFMAVGLGWYFGVLNLVLGLLILQVGLMALGLSSIQKVKQSFNFDLYIILVCAIAFGTALISTGTAAWMTDYLMGFIRGSSQFTIILSIFLITVFFTSFVTNVAAVAIVFPIAASIIPELGLPPKEVFLLIAFGASCSFLTPVSYQTNIMVYQPGGYKPIDFLKVGIPLTVLYSFICIAYFT